MITYDYGDYHIGFVWRLDGSIIPRAAFFAMPPACMAVCLRYLLFAFPDALLQIFQALNTTAVWPLCTVVLGMLLGFRTNKAYARFWEGTTLVQMMRAEWFESCSNLMSFSSISINKNPADMSIAESVKTFRYTLVRLMSLMHGAALRQIGGDVEEFDVLDVHGLDEESMEYLNHFCATHDINRVEVLLHWIQVLITDNIATGVLVIAPPILTRSYQTLSRGMVNFYNVRKLADIPFPFPLSQIIIVLLLCQSIMTPMYVASIIESYSGCALLSFLPLFGMWSVTFISGELEQPFGQDANDLPLSVLQFQMNSSLLMLLDDCSQRAPKLRQGCLAAVHELRNNLGDPSSSTEVMHSSDRFRHDGTRSSTVLRHSKWRKSQLSLMQPFVEIETPNVAPGAAAEVERPAHAKVGDAPNDLLAEAAGVVRPPNNESQERDDHAEREDTVITDASTAMIRSARASIDGHNLHNISQIQDPPPLPEDGCSCDDFRLQPNSQDALLKLAPSTRPATSSEAISASDEVHLKDHSMR